MMRTRNGTLVLLLLLLLPLLLHCGSRDERPSIVLVTLDTTRADFLGCYGDSLAETPVIDAFARGGIRYDRAFCHAPLTVPSHATMLTGRYPRSTGVMRNSDTIPESGPHVAEILAGAGYETAAFTSVKILSERAGFGRGFATFDMPESTRARPGEETVAAALAWLDARDEKTPCLLWVHLFDPHFPYRGTDGLAHYDRAASYDGPLRQGSWNEIERAAETGWSESDHERLLTLYRSMIAYSDHWIGALFEGLRSAGTWENADVYFVTDHGEAFGEGTYLEHANAIHPAVTRIGLIRKPPGRSGAAGRRAAGDEAAGAVVSAIQGGIDLAPTMLRACGIEPPSAMEGRTLYASTAEAPADRAIVIEEPPLPESAALRIADRNALFFPRPNGATATPARTSGEKLAVARGDNFFVFDGMGGETLLSLADAAHRADSVTGLRDDPGEAPGDMIPYRKSLLDWRKAHPLPDAAGNDDLDPETRRLLESLGYL
ncbi:MAG: sulfatase [Gemmatimonadetes bacterium]|nr:sulfatase [Gemmatimonadota bacterium]